MGRIYFIKGSAGICEIEKKISPNFLTFDYEYSLKKWFVDLAWGGSVWEPQSYQTKSGSVWGPHSYSWLRVRTSLSLAEVAQFEDLMVTSLSDCFTLESATMAWYPHRYWRNFRTLKYFDLQIYYFSLHICF